MATKVNKKFLFITIGAVLVLVMGIVALATYHTLKSASRNSAQGLDYTARAEAARAAGDLEAEHEFLEEARTRFGRAVAKEGSRRDYIEQYIESMLRTTPKDEITYGDRYNGDYFGALERLASLDPSNVELALRLIEARYEWVTRQGGSAETLEWVVSTCTEKLRALRDDDPLVTKIRGYRGLAQVQRMTMTSVPEDARMLALEDIEAAYAADPEALDAGFAIPRWHLAEREIQQANGRTDLAKREFELAGQALDAFLSAHPNHVIGQLMKIDLPLIEVGSTARPDVRQALQAAHEVGAAAIFARMEALPAGTMDPNDVQQLIGRVGDRVDRAAQLALVEREAAQHGTDPEWLMILGQAYQRAGERDKALATFQKVMDLPTPTLSLEGLLLPQYRRQAAVDQTSTWLGEYARATTAEARAEALAKAKESREALQARIGVRGQSQLKLIDARLALVESRYADATALLSELSREVGEDQEIEYLLATSLAAQGVMGDARQKFEDLVQSGYRLNSTLVQLADVYLKMGETQRAATLLERATKIAPDNAALARKYREVQTFLIEGGTAEGTTMAGDLDPVVKVLMEIRQAEMDQDESRVGELVAQAYRDYPGESRVIMRALQQRLVEEDRAGAIEIAKDAQARFPNSENFKRIGIALQYEDPIEAELAVIEASPLPEVEKALQRMALYVTNDMPDKVPQWLEAAEKADPNHPSVIEARFVWSLRQGDIAAARVAAQRAASVNADRAEGTTFEGRLLLAEGKANEAVRTFEGATTRLPYNAALWRLLGQSRLEAGQVPQAIDALERAIQSKPDDVSSAKMYARALARLGRNAEALAAVGRQSQVFRFVASDNELRAIWLDLEAIAGDRAEALRVRREVLKAVPEDTENALALANLLIADGAYKDAEGVLAGLEGQTVAPLVMTRLKALVARGLGTVDDGSAVFDQYAASLTDNELLVAARMAQAGYLLEAGQDDRAVAVLEAARPKQGAGYDIDRQLGNYFFNLGSTKSTEGAQLEANKQTEAAAEAMAAAKAANERAAAAYQTIIASGGESVEDGFGVSKRLVETLIRLENIPEAKKVLQQAAKQHPDDLEILILTAAIAERTGDVREAQRVLAYAVEKHPSSHLPFYRRAVLNRDDAAMFPDVIQDLDQVIRLRPDMMDAWGLKFELYRSRGRSEEALSELRKGLENASSSNADTLRRVLVQQLLNARREGEALNAAIEAADRFPDSAFWQGSTGDLARRLGRYSEASRCFQRLYDMESTLADEERSKVVAASLLDCLLQRDAEPTRGQALRLLDVVKSMEETVPTVMLQARTHAFLDNLDEMEALIDKGFDMAVALADSNMLGYWYAQMRQALGAEGEAQKWLDKLAASRGELPVSLEVRRLGYKRLVAGVTRDDIPKAESLVTNSAGDEAAQVEALKLLSNVQYDLGVSIEHSEPAEARKLFEQALDAGKRGLALYDLDLELNNNVGYILAKHLNRGDEAIPFAEQAQRIAPENSAVLDTVGVVFFEAGRLNDAVRHLQNAIRTAIVADHRVLSHIHLAQAYVALEDTRAAGQALDDAQKALEDVRTANTREQYQAEIDTVRASIR